MGSVVAMWFRAGGFPYWTAAELGFGCQWTNHHQGYAPSLVCGSFGYPSSRRFLAHVRKGHSSSETNEDGNGYRWSSPLEPEQFYCHVRWKFLSPRILSLLKLKIMPPRYDIEYQSQGHGTAGASRLNSILVEPWAICGNSERCTVVVHTYGLETLW